MPDVSMPITLQHHQSAFGEWVQAAYRPSHLNDLVDSLWYFEGRLTHPQERIFPDGRVEVNVHLGGAYGEIKGDRRVTFPEVCVSGLLLRTAVVEAPPEPTTVLGIRLMPAAASTLLGQPLVEITDSTVDLNDILAGAAAELRDRCAAAVGAEARLGVALRWLSERAALAESRHQGTAAAVIWAAREIERRRGALSIRELRGRTGWSKSRFTTAFKEQVGVTPKCLARIVRFRHSLTLMHSGRHTLAEIALRAAYYDQPHFNGEFGEFAGVAPGEYLGGLRFPGSVNLVVK